MGRGSAAPSRHCGLAEKGYSVAVLECGSRFRDEDFADLDLRDSRGATSGRRGWGMRGVLRMSFFKDVLVV